MSNRLNRIPTLMLCTLLLAMVGCAEDTEGIDLWSLGGESSPEYWAEGGEFWSANDLDVRQGALVGSIGHIEGIDDNASILSGWSDGYWTYMEVTVTTSEGAAMAVLQTPGDLTSLRAGQTYTGSAGDWEGTSVSLLGCAGPEPGYWTYDEPAQEVEVHVMRSDGGVVALEFEATFIDAAYDINGNPIEPNTPTVVGGTVTVAVD